MSDLHPINLDPRSASFQNVAEADRPLVSESFKAFDVYTEQRCVISPEFGDDKIMLDEFLDAIDATKKDFGERGFSAGNNRNFARFRDHYNYLPNFKTGAFDVYDARSRADLAAAFANDKEGLEEIWDAYDKIGVQYLDPLYGDVKDAYDQIEALANTVAGVNDIYRKNGGQKNITRPILDFSARLAANYDQFDEIVGFAGSELDAFTNDSSLAVDRNDLPTNWNLDEQESEAFLAVAEYCKPYLDGMMKETNFESIGCAAYLTSYVMTTAYDDGLGDKLAEKYPIY